MLHKTSLKTIYIVEYKTDGHHTNYVILFCKILLENGYNVVLLHPKFNEELKALNKERFTFFFVDSYNKKSTRFSALKYWWKIKNDINNAKKATKSSPELVYFLWADDLRFPSDNVVINFFNRFFVENIFRSEWSGLYFHPTHLRVHNAKKNGIDIVFSYKNCIGVNVLDEGIASILSQNISNQATVLPDITVEDNNVIDNQLANSIKKFAGGKKIISCVGAIASRKGVSEMLRLFQAKEEYKIIIAGKLIPETFDYEDISFYQKSVENSNKVFLIDRFLTNEEINTIYSCSNYIWASYNNFPHSSGVMTKAAHTHKPVIVNQGFLMAERVNKYNTGIVINNKNLEESTNILNNNLDKEWDLSWFTHYEKDHSIQKFKNIFLDFISSKIKK